MRDRDAFGTALQTLRGRLRDGAYRPGAALVIIELAQELGISPTPVREALARLTGEGLVEERKGWGTGVWRLDREACEELYGLHDLQATFALAQRQDPGRASLGDALETFDLNTAAGLRGATEALFLALVEAGCQAFALAAHRHLADRLAPLRLAEATLLGGGGDELRELAAALDREPGGAGRARLAIYHQRRRAEAGALARLVNSRSSVEATISKI